MPKRTNLDLRGRACPMPIVELMRTVRVLAKGDEVELMADDRAFPADVAAWCRKTRNVLVSLESRGEVHTAIVLKATEV
jgi:tRNA 2-thiouridine synthesizing protein A